LFNYTAFLLFDAYVKFIISQFAAFFKVRRQNGGGKIMKHSPLANMKQKPYGFCEAAALPP
jgi:hypothetical protein